MPSVGIEPTIPALRVRCLTTWPKGLSNFYTCLICGSVIMYRFIYFEDDTFSKNDLKNEADAICL